MRHFAHNIGDYAAATRHLSFVEDAAYRRLLDRYYQDEKPLPADLAAVSRLAGARTKDERQAVANVLAEFFVLKDDGYHQSRADREIETYRAKAQLARENGTKGGRPINREKTKTVFAQVRSEKLTTNHSPLPIVTTNHTGGANAGARDDAPTVVPREFAEAARARGRAMAQPLSVEWAPDESDMAHIAKARPDLDAAAIALQTEKFRAHALSNNRTSHSWGQSWRKWVLDTRVEPLDREAKRAAEIEAALERSKHFGEPGYKFGG
jgi:uncharacterized protein YdaU (DUF1376 family)